MPCPLLSLLPPTHHPISVVALVALVIALPVVVVVGVGVGIVIIAVLLGGGGHDGGGCDGCSWLIGHGIVGHTI